jgi:16S rRNA (uracil1498-N3)-methyltransferase
MEYYYTPKKNINTVKNTLIIDDDFEYRHLAKVLRKKPGEKIDVTDGELNIYRCEISEITKDSIRCSITKTERDLYEPDKKIHLYLSPLKSADRFEFAIEKAVELGVHSITPVITRHTVNKSAFNETKLNRLHRISMSAMGQSQRCYLPKVNNIITFDKLLEDTISNKNRIVMYEFSEKDTKFVYDLSSKDVFLLIGPEGGFTEEEIFGLRDSGWQVGSLGDRKLRAETAAIVSIFEIINR